MRRGIPHVGTTPPSTVVYGILCFPKALFVRTEVTVSHLQVICEEERRGVRGEGEVKG